MCCPARSRYPLMPDDNPPVQRRTCADSTARVGSLQDFFPSGGLTGLEARPSFHSVESLDQAPDVAPSVARRASQ